MITFKLYQPIPNLFLAPGSGQSYGPYISASASEIQASGFGQGNKAIVKGTFGPTGSVVTSFDVYVAGAIVYSASGVDIRYTGDLSKGTGFSLPQIGHLNLFSIHQTPIRIIGSDGNDRIRPFMNEDLFAEGGSGTDTVQFWGLRQNHEIQRSGDSISVSAIGSYGEKYALTSVERIEFSDAAIAFDTAGNAGQAYRLYQAAFNRTPDQGGFTFQMKALDNGLSLKQVAQNFLASPEFQSTYGARLSDSQFVNQLYQNVLHRAPDSGGLAYQVSALSSGTDRAQLLVNFSESPENQAALIGVIQNGMTYTA